MSSDLQSSDQGAPELTALNAVVRALRPLPQELRRRVIDSAMLLLGSTSGTLSTSSPPVQTLGSAGPSEAGTAGTAPATDIRRLKEQKSPDSANEMAALIAYYLSEVVPTEARKPTVGIADINKYFKQAQFRLPNTPKMILVNAKNAGYFDSAGGGQYRLNPVGYNLVVHSLPRSGAGAVSSGRSRKRRNKPGKNVKSRTKK